MNNKDTILAVPKKLSGAVSTEKPKPKIKKKTRRIFDWKYAEQATKKPKTKKRIYRKFDYKYIEQASRMKASGLSEDYIAWVLVDGDRYTIRHWKKCHPEFKKAMDDAAGIQKAILIDRGLKAAMGYRYEEAIEKYMAAGTDEEGNVKYVLKEKIVFKKERPPDAKLITFFLAHADPEFRRLYRKDNISQGSTHIHITGEVVKGQISDLAGKYLTEPVKVIDNEIIENPDSK